MNVCARKHLLFCLKKEKYYERKDKEQTEKAVNTETKQKKVKNKE